VYDPGGRLNVTIPCELVTPCNPNEAMVTFAPSTALPWLSTTLMFTVMLGEGTVIPEVIVVAVVAVSAVVEVDTVNVEVSVTVVNPPNAPKRSIVEIGKDDDVGQPPPLLPKELQLRIEPAPLKSGAVPTIHPSLGEII